MNRQALVMAAVVAMLPMGLVSSPVGANAPLEVGHFDWLRVDRTWVSAAGHADLNDDGIDDVVVAGSDREATQLANVGSVASMAEWTATARPSKLTAVDGADGVPLWSVEWQPETDRSVKDEYETVHGLLVGDIDGSGVARVLVSRTTVVLEQRRVVAAVDRITMYDGRTGAVLWEESEMLTGSVHRRRALTLVSDGDRSFVAAATTTIDDENGVGSTVTHAELYRLAADGPPERVMRRLIADDQWGTTVPFAVGDRVAFVVSARRWDETGASLLPAELEVYEATLDGASHRRWSLPSVGGGEVVVTQGTRPLVVVDTAGGLRAFALADGAPEWSHPLVAGDFPTGTLTAGDVDGDGVGDIVASPVSGGNLYPNDSTTALVAISGVDGHELWRVMEPLARFGAGMLRVEADAAGRAVVIAVMIHRDAGLYAHFEDDPGLVATYDAETGSARCRFSTDRTAPFVMGPFQGNGPDLVAVTLGGNAYGFAAAAPACSLGP